MGRLTSHGVTGGEEREGFAWVVRFGVFALRTESSGRVPSDLGERVAWIAGALMMGVGVMGA